MHNKINRSRKHGARNAIMQHATGMYMSTINYNNILYYVIYELYVHNYHIYYIIIVVYYDIIIIYILRDSNIILWRVLAGYS